MPSLKNEGLQRRLSVNPGKIINSYETRSLGQTKRPSSYSNSPQPTLAPKQRLRLLHILWKATGPSLILPHQGSIWKCMSMYSKDQIHFSSTESYINVNGYKINSSKIFERSSKWRWLQQPQLWGGGGNLQQNSMEKYSFSRVSHTNT